MKHNFKKILLLTILLIPIYTIAQSSFTLSGTVENKVSKEKVVLVAIQIKELNRWTTSNMLGEFKFNNIPEGKYTLLASCLGFEKYESPVSVDKNINNYKIQLSETTLGLEEVTVVAQENTSLSSSSKIESSALEHVQPTNLADVMQLVPGQISLNPDLSKANQIAIRDINNYDSDDKTTDPDDNDALGTAIIVDGTPVDNDANMQTINTVSGGTAQGYSTAGQGVDLRQISAESIESVEIIRGIPSVQYGDLTTGAVLVKTKAGRTPLNVKIKADPKIKQAAISKGFLLPGKNKGAINLDFDYTYAYDDIREPASKYKRVTGQIGYSNTLFKESKPLSINAKIGYYRTIDDEKSDPDQTSSEREKETESGIDLKLYGKWSIQKWWLGNISYNFSGSFKKQDLYQYQSNSTSIMPIPTSYTSGEYATEYLPSNYYSELNMEGKPYNYFASIKLDCRQEIGKIGNRLLYGFDWRTTGNNGDGRKYDLTRPPKGAVTTRPRAFKDVPESRKLALFAEDEVTVPIGNTQLKTQFGIRYNNLSPKGIFSTDGFTTVEPRLNTTYKLLKHNKNRTLQDLTLRFGYGKTSKTPTMLHLYPDKAYIDEVSFNYYPELAVVTTKVIEDTSNPDLKPMKNKKLEAGIDFSIKGIKFMVTGFKEKIRDGFSWEKNYFTMDYKKWNTLTNGSNPVFSDGNITYTDTNNETQTLAYETETEFEYYNTPINNYSVDKKGIEYVVDFGKLKQIRTDFRVDGAYYHIKRISYVKPFPNLVSSTYQGDYFPYLSMFAGNRGKIKQRFNSNFKTTTHIPALKMLFTFTLQMIWMEKEQRFWDDENGTSRAYSLGENNEKQYGQFKNAEIIYIDPAGFYDMDMQYHEWQDDYAFQSPYSSMVLKMDNDYFDKETYPINWQVNLKLTKEFGEFAKLSFFANNLFDHRPLVWLDRDKSYTRRNQPAYFGAELTFRF